MTDAHVEKETLTVAVNIPQHDDRGGATPTFVKSRLVLIAREGGRCYICGRTAEQSGHPLEGHHHPVERCFAEEIDWEMFRDDCKMGMWGPHAQAFDWNNFFDGAIPVTVTVTYPADLIDGNKETTEIYTYLHPKDIYLFVDDMTVNGELVCRDHHTVADEGKHTIPFPIWIAQRYARKGVRFSDREVIHRAV